MAISTREWTVALAERVRDLQSALAFATRLPLPPTAPSPPLVRALRMLPLVGAIVGTLAALVFVLATAIGLQPALAAVVALAFQAWITGALHEDGLADFADGVGGGSSRERKLAIMRDSRIGTFGVLALVFVILCKVLALGEAGAVSGQLAVAALITAGALSRLAPILLLHRLPPARLDGMSYEVGCPDKETMTEATVYAVAPAILIAMAVRGAGPLLAAFLASAVAYWAVENLSRRHLGGQTGDAAGASQQLVELVVLLAFAAIPPS
jgi:adenosylcobinamide-GDP ribazoletransferase